MGQAVGQIVSFGVVVGLSPPPIIAIVLILAGPKGRTGGTAILLGWVLGLSVLGAAVLLLAEGIGATSSEGPATWVNVVKLILGLALLLLAVKQWRGRPAAGAEPELPSWMARIDTLTPTRCGSLALALAALNPKNLLVTVSAGAAIAQTGVGTGSQVGALAVFIALGTAGVATPVGIYSFAGERAAQILGGLRDWMVRENSAVMAVLCLVIGAKLIGDAISGLAT